jgi:hypothetical protein
MAIILHLCTMKKLYFSIALSIALFSCREKGKVDVLPPVINSVLVNDSTASLYWVVAPAPMTIDVQATDNMELNQIKVEVVPVDFRSANSAYGLNSGDYSFSQIFNVSGLNANQQLEVNLPDSIAGNWNIKVTVSDDFGYLATPFSAVLNIENPQLPAITATTEPPVVNGIITMEENTNLEVSGTVFDADSLDYVQVRIEGLTGTVYEAINIPFTNTGISFTPTFDDAEAGHFFLVIEGRDKLGYRRLWSAHVIVNG